MSENTFSLMLNAITRMLLPAGIRQAMRRWLTGSQEMQAAIPPSNSYEVVEGKVLPELMKGWQEPVVAARQHKAFLPLLQEMYKGKAREDFVAVAKAVAMTGLENPLIIEVGCGSGWNSEVLAYLLKKPVRYIGMDYAPAMTSLGKESYPNVQFVVGDATELPLREDSCDILLSGTVLMHLLGYKRAIVESIRVARHWCIFHTIPILTGRETTVLRKNAYGQDTIEMVFNEDEFYQLVAHGGLAIRHELDNIPYDLAFVLGESTVTKTYVCEVVD